MPPGMSRLSVSAARADALFAPALQPSDEPGAIEVQGAIAGAARRFGGQGCAGRVAQEFGDHADIAVARMRGVRQVIDEVLGGPGLPDNGAQKSARQSAALGGHAA
jgi:hypothetical protein